MTDLSAFEPILAQRSSGACELCGGREAPQVHALPHSPQLDASTCVWLCSACAERGAAEHLDDKDWFGLKEAAWSEHAAVQVLALRLLRRLDAAWASDLADQIYMDEATLAWANAATAVKGEGEGEGEGTDRVRTLDSNGTELLEGDTVTLIKDLDVKGTSFVAKRGTTVKNIHLIGDPDNIEGRVNKVQLVLKTCFLKKA